MSRYSEFFLKTASSVVELELIEISHPNFSKVYRIVRNAVNGVSVTLEDATVQFFEYYPLKITLTGASDDLEQTLRIELGDLGELLPTELDAVFQAEGFDVKPTLLYRTYRSDDLSAPLNGPLRFEIGSVPFKKEGASLEARAPRLNQVATGETYSINRFPMLSAYL